MRLDEVDLDRYWRFALPAAIAGFVASAALLVAGFVVELSDAVVALDMVLFLGIFPVHLGTVLTARRGIISFRDRDHSALYWIVRSVASAAFFMALVYWRDLWAGPHNEVMVLAVVAAFYGLGVEAGLRYRRSALATTSDPDSSGPATGPPDHASAAPPSARPMPPPPVTAQPPWATPFDTPGADSAESVSRWPQPDQPRPGRRQASSTPWRFLPPVVAAGAVLAFMATRPTTNSIVGPDDRPFYIATVVGGQPEVGSDRGDTLDDPPDAIRAAACRNYRDFLDDVALEPDLVILDDPGLVRSAELLDGEWTGDQVALDAETLLVQEGDPPRALARMEDEQWSTADKEHASRYFTARMQPPSARALDHSYVTYMAARSASSSLVVRLAVDPEAEKVSKPRFGRIGDISVRLAEGPVVRVNESLCWK